MAYSFISFNQKKDEVLKWLASEYRSIQTGRATPQVLDLVHIDLYGTRTPVAHAASINMEDPKTLRVAPWDKQIISDIEKAINEADLGLSVSSDGAGLRVHFPALTTESRQKLVKLLKDRLEDARVKIRGLREETNKEIDTLAKENEFGEDDHLRYKEETQKHTDLANAEVEALFERKEKEVMGE